MPDVNRKTIAKRGAMIVESKIRTESSPHPYPVPAPDESIVQRIEHLPRDVGWMLFGVGFAGFVAPGIFGLPFMVAGGMILWPKTTKRLQGILGKSASGQTHAPGMKQITRFLNDLERRYPHPQTGKK